MQASTITSKVGSKILLEHSFMVGLVGVRRGLQGVRAAAKAQIIACRSITPSCTARLNLLGKWGRGFATRRAGKGLTAGEQSNGRMSRQYKGCRSKPKHTASRMASSAVTQSAHDDRSRVQATDISLAYTVGYHISRLLAHDQHAIARQHACPVVVCLWCTCDCDMDTASVKNTTLMASCSTSW